MNANHDLLAYVEGPYARVDDERTDVDLVVEGELPQELHGMFVQNSPNPKYTPPGFYHWFDGDGMVHGVHLDGGKATYRNRYVRTAGLAADDEAGRALKPGILGTFDPSAPGCPDKNTANTDLLWHKGRLLALWWLSGTPYRIAVPSLETVGEESYGGTLTTGVSAHSKADPRTGELVFFDYDAYRSTLRHGTVSADGVLTHQAELTPPGPSLYHDLAITDRYTVIPHFPMVYDARRLAEGKRRVRFDREQPARFCIVPRHGGDAEARWFEVDTCYSYHMVNAFEGVDARGHETVTVLGCRIEDPIPHHSRDEDPEVPRLFYLRLEPYLHEWTFDLTDGTSSERRLDDVPTEFPRMNDRVLGSAARWAYHPRVRRGATLLFDGVVKYDVHKGGSTFHAWGPDQIGAEVVFAPRFGATEEDDGWLTTFVSDLREGQSWLAVLDAKTLDEVARVRMPRRVPFGFHAEWVPGEEMA